MQRENNMKELKDITSLNLRSETGETVSGSPMQTSPSLELREGENAGSIRENVILKFINLWHGLSAFCALSSPPPLHTFSSSTRTPLPPTTGQYQLQTRTPHEEKKQDGISTCSAVLFSENPNQNPVQRKRGKAGWSLS